MLDRPDPLMLDVAAADAPIGTPFGELERLAADYADLGVKMEWLRKEAPRFHLRLEAYRIAERPVSRAEYRRFLQAHDETAALVGDDDAGAHPARLSFEEAEAYAAWLGRETGRNFRLPTEFEWEYAAAGPHGWPFPWGRRWREGIANTRETGHHGTRPIGENQANRSWCGAIDMAGNVEEWTSSLYQPYPGGTAVNDAFNAGGQPYRILRGGSFMQGRDCARAQRRHGAFEDSAIGLRLAETI